MVGKLKTIKIKEDTHGKLADLGKKGDSFDGLINMLLTYFKKNEKNRREQD